MTNFHFLQSDWPDIFDVCRLAEDNALKIPNYSAMSARMALEKMVHWLYENDSTLVKPYDTTLSTLIHSFEFKTLVGERIFREINIIRKIGNDAVHGTKINADTAVVSLKCLHTFSAFFAKYYSTEIPQIDLFQEAYLPSGEEEKILKRQLELIQEKIEKQAFDFLKSQKELEQKLEYSEVERQKLTEQQAVFTNRREYRQKTSDLEITIPHSLSEQETRSTYIDLYLSEASWCNLQKGRDIEFEVTGIPKSINKSGIGYVDYVLWGENGLPLAVIEAKKTLVGIEKGKQQAVLYADCLEQMYKQRPIIFYTNGYDTILWDDLFYAPREVEGFYTRDELQLLVDRRRTRLDLRSYKINSEIAGRPYQIEAVKRVAEHFCGTRGDQLVGLNRRSLLVMATGSGKTRTAASIVDMLTKCNWAKRILFLADRNALVTQAKNSISTLLPHLTSIDLTKEREDNGTRMVFSTYPTMLNKIDSLLNKQERFYGVGHFDVIFVDEAHRSVYQKYKAIFDYFDSLVIGLTATPKKEVDKNTYELFGIEDDNPTFAYELNQAVKDGYLVPAKIFSCELKFMRDGIKYKDLSPGEKKEYEEKFGDPTHEMAPDEIDNSALNNWLFNNDTIDKALDYLMTNGIKVEGGDKIGKTIIFAKSHQHAQFIEERFNKNYPEYSGHFLRTIDNYELRAQDLLEKFVNDKIELDPQIAVSVDMMDTGVDAPRVVNLVFFKPVKSVSKFWQMIGRGTRLRPNLFGPDEHKTHFLIFDFCQNFEFFDENKDGDTSIVQKSLSQRIFEIKLDITQAIDNATIKSSEDDDLKTFYLAMLHLSIAELDRNRFIVRKELRMVDKYKSYSRWGNLSKSDCFEIKQHLSHLPVSANSDESAKRFDLLILNIELCMLENLDDSGYCNQVIKIAKNLAKKTTVPAIQNQMEWIDKIQQTQFWQNRNLNQMENLRVALRELVKFLDREEKSNYYTAFQDDLNLKSFKERDFSSSYQSTKGYKDRVEKYIRDHKDHLVIHKLKNNIPITKEELILLESIVFDDEICGTKEDFLAHYGEQPLGTFIRSILGLEIQAANEAFTDFMQVGNLTANQMTFIQNIIQYLTKNGVVEKRMLFEPPFTDQHQDGIIGIFDDALSTRIFKIVDQINNNAGA